MFAANTYKLRFATEEDAHTLRRLAELDSRTPLAGRVLIGEIAGSPAAALSLGDDRVIADPFRRTDHLVACLRIRAGARPSARGHPVAERTSARRVPPARGIGRDRIAGRGRPRDPGGTDAQSRPRHPPAETALDPPARRRRTHLALGHVALTRRGPTAQRAVRSGRRDLNPRPPAPKAGALPGCATSRWTRTMAEPNVRQD